MTAAIDDLESLLHARLGRDYDHEKIAAVCDFARAMHRERERLRSQVQQVSGRDLAEQMNVALAGYLQQVAEVLGPDDYRRVFGKMPGDPTGVVDPAIAERAYRP
jgi:hypothetical protein